MSRQKEETAATSKGNKPETALQRKSKQPAAEHEK